MRIGIANSLNLEKRTGVEEYVYQILKHLPLVDDNKNHQLFLLAPFISNEVRNFAGYTPNVLKWPFKKFWTQIRLSWEMLKNPVDVLFVPAHTFPFFSPKLVITIHGLEYENVPKMYSWFQRLKLKFFTKRNAKNAEKIIVPSQSVKDDLIKFYPAIFKKGGTSKIFVIHHGISSESGVMSNEQKNNKPYILYLGGKHKRKNIDGLKKA